MQMYQTKEDFITLHVTLADMKFTVLMTKCLNLRNGLFWDSSLFLFSFSFFFCVLYIS